MIESYIQPARSLRWRADRWSRLDPEYHVPKLLVGEIQELIVRAFRHGSFAFEFFQFAPAIFFLDIGQIEWKVPAPTRRRRCAFAVPFNTYDEIIRAIQTALVRICEGIGEKLSRHSPD